MEVMVELEVSTAVATAAVEEDTVAVVATVRR
jgi:hypothetical protein